MSAFGSKQRSADAPGEKAEEHVCRHTSRVVKEMSRNAGGATIRVGTERAGETAAHPNTVEAARDSGDEDQKVIAHRSSTRCPIRARLRLLPLARQRDDPDEEGDGSDCKPDEDDPLRDAQFKKHEVALIHGLTSSKQRDSEDV